MSGYSSLLINDRCAIDQYYKFSREEANYSLFQGSYVNPNFNNEGQIFCKADKLEGIKTIKDERCKPCMIKGKIGTGPSSFVDKVSLEDELRGTNRHSSKCNEEQFFGSHLSGKQWPTALNPIVCDRYVFPTNMQEDWPLGFQDSSN